MIQASVHGRIGNAPVVSVTKTGKSMCRVSIAVDVTAHNARLSPVMKANAARQGGPAPSLPTQEIPMVRQVVTTNWQ